MSTGGGSHHRRSQKVDPESLKHLHLDVGKLRSGEEMRTTLRVANIPNKYTRQMLVDELDEKHRSCYDFLYLPIDFRNKCNLGYAFINMITPSDVVSLHKNLRGESWKQSRSEKKADIMNKAKDLAKS